MSRLLTLAAIACLVGASEASTGGFLQKVPTIPQQLQAQRGRHAPGKSQKKRRKERRRRGA